jgi:hypothetical protein
MIWFVTGNGIDFFDGNRFEKVISWEFNPWVFSNRICFEDSNGLIWIKVATADGFELKWIDARTKEEQTDAPAILKYYRGNFYDIAVGTENSLLILDQQGQLWEIVEEKEPELRFSKHGDRLAFCSMEFNRHVIWLYERNSGEKKTDCFVQYIAVRRGVPDFTVKISDETHRPQVLPDGTLWTVGKRDFGKITPDQPLELHPISRITRLILKIMQTFF